MDFASPRGRARAGISRRVKKRQPKVGQHREGKTRVRGPASRNALCGPKEYKTRSAHGQKTGGELSTAIRYDPHGRNRPALAATDNGVVRD
jgi:hypothetical protein